MDWKRPELFVRLAKELPRYNFKIGGPISYDNECYSSLKDEINKIPNLEILPFIDNIDEFLKFQYYNRASMFIETLTRGGFENTAIQALMREVPIISYEYDFDNLLEQESDAVTRAIEVLNNRINQYGVSEPSIKKQGSRRIIL